MYARTIFVWLAAPFRRLRLPITGSPTFRYGRPPWAVRAPAGLTPPDREAAVMGLQACFVRRLARLASASEAAGHAALTFDDGLVDNAETLAPLLQEEGVTATVFVVSGWLGQPHPSAPWTRIMTEAELTELRARGVEIGAPPGLPSGSQHALVRGSSRGAAGSKKQLEAVLGEPVRWPRTPTAVRTRERCGLPRRRVPRRMLRDRARLLGRPARPSPARHGEPLDHDRAEAQARRPLRAAAPLCPARAARRLGRRLTGALR